MSTKDWKFAQAGFGVPIGNKNQTNFASAGKTHYMKLLFKPGASIYYWTYPQNERIGHIRYIKVKEYCISVEPNGANEIPAGIDLNSYPSIFKSNFLYEPQAASTDCIPMVLHHPWKTDKGNIRFDYEYSSIGLLASETPPNSERYLPNNITFYLTSPSFTPAVPPSPYPGALPGASKAIEVAEESWVTLEIGTWEHKQEDISNPLFSIPNAYYL